MRIATMSSHLLGLLPLPSPDSPKRIRFPRKRPAEKPALPRSLRFQNLAHRRSSLHNGCGRGCSAETQSHRVGSRADLPAHPSRNVDKLVDALVAADIGVSQGQGRRKPASTGAPTTRA